MSDSRNAFGENLTVQASRAYTVAGEHCKEGSDGCHDFHILYPYLRATGLVGGVEADRTQLVPIMANLAASGVQRWLIPGAADSGILATIAHAIGALENNQDGELIRRTHHFTLLDICATPLALNREYADAHGLQLDGLCADLGTVEFAPATFDAIIGHMVLTFLPPERQLATLLAMAKWLHPQRGRLVLTMRFGEEEPTPEMGEYLISHRTHTLSKLASDARIHLPEAEVDFFARVERMARQSFHQWETNLATPEDVVSLLTQAEFVVEQMVMRDSEQTRPVGYPGGPVRPRATVVARPKQSD